MDTTYRYFHLSSGIFFQRLINARWRGRTSIILVIGLSNAAPHASMQFWTCVAEFFSVMSGYAKLHNRCLGIAIVCSEALVL